MFLLIIVERELGYRVGAYIYLRNDGSGYRQYETYYLPDDEVTETVARGWALPYFGGDPAAIAREFRRLYGGQRFAGRSAESRREAVERLEDIGRELSAWYLEEFGEYEELKI